MPCTLGCSEEAPGSEPPPPPWPQDREKGGFNAPVEEEFEDDEGNVYNKKTYEDLRRQGII